VGALPGKELGRITHDGRSERPTQVTIRKGLPDHVYRRTQGHEIGHIIDKWAGEIPLKNLEGKSRAREIRRELELVYHQLSDGSFRRLQDNVARKYMTLPQESFGYSKEEAPRELMAEAIRAYMADPNYFKTVAPLTAALIRKAVNGNPRVSHIIQFNGLGPMALATGTAPMGLLDRHLGGTEPRNHKRGLLEFIANQDLDKMGR